MPITKTTWTLKSDDQVGSTQWWTKGSSCRTTTTGEAIKRDARIHKTLKGPSATTEHGAHRNFFTTGGKLSVTGWSIRGQYGTQEHHKLFAPCLGDSRSFNRDQTATSSAGCNHCHQTGHWARARPRKENQDKTGSSGNHLNKKGSRWKNRCPWVLFLTTPALFWMLLRGRKLEISHQWTQLRLLVFPATSASALKYCKVLQRIIQTLEGP